MNSNVYDFFDDIVCINLDISKDRKIHAEKIFKDLNIPARFFEATRHAKGGMYGCFDSHIKVLKEAHSKNLNNILVFEDDFLPTESYSIERIQKAVNFMKNNKWDMFFMGYSTLKDNKDGFSTIMNGEYFTPDIIKFKPFFTHAFCYNKKAIEKVLEEYDEYIGVVHYDMFLSSYLDLKSYCMLPMLFDQNFYFEHNNQSVDCLEYILRASFPMLAYTKINYRISILKYYTNIFYFRYSQYFNLLLLSIFLYFVKSRLIASNQYIFAKKNINIK